MNRRYTTDTVNNGVAWKTPSCICNCQWCIKSEVFCSNCWMLRQRLEAAAGCRRGPQYDGKCSFYLNCYFFHTSPTNRDLRDKAVYFPSRHCVRPRDYHCLGLTHIQFHPAKVTPLTNPAIRSQISRSVTLLLQLWRLRMAQQPSKWSHQHNRSAYFPKWKKAPKCTWGAITGPKHCPAALLIQR